MSIRTSLNKTFT